MASKGLHDKYSNYHYCIVRECKNTSINNPEKLWIKAPSDESMRHTWLQLAQRDPVTVSSGTAVYFCEDHFNLENDMENYVQYKVMGTVKRIRIRPNCVPSQFGCQMERKPLVTNDDVNERAYPNEQPSLSTTGCCMLCFSENIKVFGIQNTTLEKVLTKIVDFKVKADYLCYICLRRLQQCCLLIKLVDHQIAQNRRRESHQAIEHSYSSLPLSAPQPTLVHLQKQNIEKESIPYHTVKPKEEPSVNSDRIDGQICFEYEVTIKEEIEDIAEFTDDYKEKNTDDYKEKNYSTVLTENKVKGNFKRKRIKKETKRSTETLCDVCGKTFVNKYSMASHMVIHTGEKAFKCETCGRQFSLQNALTIHRRIHSGEKPFKCEECGRNFITSGYLTKHMRTHTGDTPYACDTCGKRFKQKGCLNNHNRRHTGEKPYECEICLETFVDSSSLGKHRRRTHLRVNYPCEICNKRFTRRETLKDHVTQKHSRKKLYD